MQAQETQNEGLKRAYRLTVTVADIEARIDAEVTKLAPQIKMPGFRPGKVPADRKSTRLNSSHRNTSRMPSSA